MNTAPISRKVILIIATAAGMIVANIYYAQPIVNLIADSLKLSHSEAGLVATTIQIGYGLGVFFLIPLGDIVRVKKLVIAMMATTILGVLGLSYFSTLAPYLTAALVTGIGASAVQVLVPYTAGLVPPEESGKTVGTLMSGLMVGIMMSRPISSLLADFISWHYIYLISAILMFFVTITLVKFLPDREVSDSTTKYSHLIFSMAKLFKENSILRRRSLYQACLFATFCLFWTATPLYLMESDYQLTHTEIAIYALVGVSGAIVAPLAGIAADKGKIKVASIWAMSVSSISFIITHLFAEGTTAGLVMMVLSAILLDAGITLNMVLGQREVFAIAPELRSRLNGVYVSMIFVGGGLGSALGTWSYDKGGWSLTSLIGLGLPLAALLYFFTEFLNSSKKTLQEH